MVTALEQRAVDAAEKRFTHLYEVHYRAILAYVARRLDSMASAQDLTEETFLVAWRKLDQVPPDEEGLYWLYGVARNLLANHHRRTSRRRSIAARFRLEGDAPEPPEDQLIRNDEARAVLEGLERLRDQDRELIRLAYWDELPHAAIAELLGCSRNAVGVRLHRAVKRLEKAMAHSGHSLVGEFRVGAPEETPS